MHRLAQQLQAGLSALTGSALYYAKLSAKNAKEGTDKGEDDEMSRILWFAAKGKTPYPRR